jgi:hypothetical protein
MAGSKLQEILRVCAVEYIQSPGALDDGWANNDVEADTQARMGALSILDPHAEGQRNEALRQFEHLVSLFPEFMPGAIPSPQSLNFGLTQLNAMGLRAVRSHSMTPYDELKSSVSRTRAGDILQMGYGNCVISLDVGDRDAQGRVVPLVRVVETMEQVQAICDTTVIRTNLLTKGVDNWVKACIPSFLTDIVVNPTGAMNAKGQLTGDPIKGMDNRPLCGGIWQESALGFAQGESSAITTAKNPQILARSKFENNGTSIFMTKVQMDAGLERLGVVQAQTRAELVSMVRKELQHKFSYVTDLQLLAEPAIAVHDETWCLLLCLAKHATRWNNLCEANKKTPHPTACPFGYDGVMMTQMRQVNRLFQMVDMDARAIPRCQTRRMAAMFMRLAGLKRVVEYFDAYAGRMFDLSAVMRATKGGKVVPAPAAALKVAEVPKPKKTAPTASGGATSKQSTEPSTNPSSTRRAYQPPSEHAPTAAPPSASCLPVGGASSKLKSVKEPAAAVAKGATPWSRGKKAPSPAPKSATASASP